jgi:hypothetical protein
MTRPIFLIQVNAKKEENLILKRRDDELEGPPNSSSLLFNIKYMMKRQQYMI